MKKQIFLSSIVTASLSACATKGYHIAAPLSDAKAEKLNCRELAFELQENDELAVSINDEAKTDLRSVGAFLVDFGIGNAMAKGRAEEAFAERRASITAAMAEKGCGYSDPVTPKAEEVEMTEDAAMEDVES